MRLVLQDTMTDADGVALTAHRGEQGNVWALQFDTGTPPTSGIASNRMWINQPAGFEARWSSSLSGVGPEQIGEMVIRTLTDEASDPALMVRGNADASDGYVMQYERAFSTGMNLQRYVAGANTSLGTWAFANGVGVDVTLRLEVTDGRKRILVDGVERITSTDNTVVTGSFVGITAYNMIDSASVGQHIDRITVWEPEIQFRSISTTTNSTAGTTMTMTKPAGIANGDVLFVAIAQAVNQASDPTAPAGWTLALARVNNGSNAITMWVYWKPITDAAGEAATYQWTGLTSARGIGHILAYSGVDQAVPVHVSGSSANTISTNILAPSVNPLGVQDDRLLVCYGTRGAGAITVPSPQAERGDSNTTAIALSVADEVLLDAAATGTRTATGTSGINTGICLLLQKARERPPGPWVTRTNTVIRI